LNTQNKQIYIKKNFRKKNLQQTQEGTSNYQNKPTTLQYLSAFFTRKKHTTTRNTKTNQQQQRKAKKNNHFLRGMPSRKEKIFY